ncbi:MAG: C45 family peptidase [Castellaniella sp.]|uniref:C45 family peptidase n=1 Tax=Castellaniella sp. TaxID=1955812 RepID=UPI002A36197C|nr:C45 family peptidase [Castellaniella sp.]MDY0310059.1 C45 family peptidase [Castellaniella sp.]
MNDRTSRRLELAPVQAHGSHRNIGLALGRWGAEACHRHLIHSDAWAQVAACRSRPEIPRMRALLRHAFPWIEDELAGLAEGLELPLDDVFLWNCRGDLWALAPDGCTTVLAPQRLSHNEDGDPGFAGFCGLAEVRPDGAPAFASFVYPGSLPGHTFAVNAAGLAMTVNNIRARQAAAGLPRMALTRALLAVKSADEAVSVLQAHPRMGAFHLGLGQAGATQTWSVEFSQLAVSVHPVTHTSAVHANHALHDAQAELPQIITDSSAHRQSRGEALLAQGAQALAILSDTGDAAEPILRQSPSDTDQENTLATADIDLSGTTARWAVYAPGAATPHHRFEGLHRLT